MMLKKNLLAVVSTGALLCCVVGSLGCLNTSTHLANGKIDGALQTAKATPGDDCLVTIELSHKDGGYALRSEQNCIKTRNGALAFGGPIKLLYAPRTGWAEDYNYCGGESEVVGKTGLRSCTWNQAFRDRYPLTFRVSLTQTAESENYTLADFIQLAHVFRNGELVFRWQPVDPRAIAFEIPGDRLEATGVPHGAPIDLRLYPVGEPLSEELVSKESKERESKFARRFEAASRAAVRAAFPKSDKQLMCFLEELDAVRSKVSEVAQRPPPTKLVQTAQSQGDCKDAAESAELRKTLETMPNFTEAYAKLKSTAREQLEESLADFNASATSALGDLGIALRVDLATIKARLATELEQLAKSQSETETELNANVKTAEDNASETAKVLAAKVGEIKLKIERLKQTMAQLDEIAVATMGSLDEGIELVGAIKADFANLSVDAGERAAEIHAAVFNDLRDQGDFFEPRSENPPLTGKESALQMEYSDKIQFFFLSPWNGVPIRLSGSERVEASGMYAVPIIDAFGWRYQFGTSRFAEIRGALGSATIDDKVEGTDQSEIRWAGVLSFSVANFRIGAAVVPEADQTSADWRNYFRIIAGLDVYKIFTGRQVEVTP